LMKEMHHRSKRARGRTARKQILCSTGAELSHRYDEWVGPGWCTRDVGNEKDDQGAMSQWANSLRYLVSQASNPRP
jgi:hypothetical protein